MLGKGYCIALLGNMTQNYSLILIFTKIFTWVCKIEKGPFQEEIHKKITDGLLMDLSDDNGFHCICFSK